MTYNQRPSPRWGGKCLPSPHPALGPQPRAERATRAVKSLLALGRIRWESPEAGSLPPGLGLPGRHGRQGRLGTSGT